MKTFFTVLIIVAILAIGWWFILLTIHAVQDTAYLGVVFSDLIIRSSINS